MRVAWLLAATLLLAACAPQPVSTGANRSETGSNRPENSRAKVHTELAAQYFAARQYAVSLQELRIALEADPAYAPTYNMLGLVHGALGEDRLAEEHFRKSIGLWRNYSEAHNNYGHFLCQRNHYDESLTQFNAALQNPIYATPETALANAGYCALLKGDQAGAEKFLRRALARIPNQRLALVGMAELHLQQNNPFGARANLERLKALGELDVSGIWLALRVERSLGNKGAEAAHAAVLRERYPESKEARWLFNGQYDMLGSLP
jgi:type IV pilus assembly protein PilF